MIALINHVLASSLEKKKKNRLYVQILRSCEDDRTGNLLRQCTSREFDLLYSECPRGYFLPRSSFPAIGRVGFIQLIRVTPRNTRSDRDEHVLGGFDSQLAHVRRWSVVFAGQWWRRDDDDDDDDGGGGDGGGGSSGGGGFLRQPRGL